MYAQLENEIRKTIAFEVKGDSMKNGTRSSFEAGDRLIVKPFSIDDFRNNISNDLNSFWVIEIEQGFLFKQIVEYDNTRDVIRCHSLNVSEQYQDTFVEIENITKIGRVIESLPKAKHYSV
jgi:hypothetical protein